MWRALLPEPVSLRAPRTWAVAVMLLMFALVPVHAHVFDQPFYMTQFGRILVYAIAACSLNLLIGWTGLVSLGHAMYLAIGAYAVAILDFHGVHDGWLQLGTGLAGAAVVALLTGVVVLRTSGMGFIMITLAFAQMFYFLGVSLKHYGGDDGMRLTQRSVLAPLDLGSPTQRYYLVLGGLVLLLYLSWRLVHARFGHVLRGIKANERRMRALGFEATRLKLVVYVIAACVASFAGFLLANLTGYASPSYTAWTVSGELIVMVILGGAGTVIGPLVGALALLLLEEWLAALTTHWMAPLGLAILLVVVLTRRGLYGAFLAWSRERAP